MNHTVKRILGLLLILLTGIKLNAGELKTYPAPEGIEQNKDFSVKVRVPGHEWMPLDIYNIKVDAVIGVGHTQKNSSMTGFDFSDKVEVMVVYNKGKIAKACIRPLSNGITPQISGNKLSFTLIEPKNLSIEINGDIFHNLQLFANPLECEIPQQDSPNVIYFGPGIHNIQGDVLNVPSDKTVYLAGGAVVKGQINIDHAQNVRICGRGMIDQDVRHGLRIAHSKNVMVEGVFGSQFFTGGSDSVMIKNVKCISYMGNGDGMNIISSRHVMLDGVFNRNSDDCVTVYGTRGGFTGSSSNIIVKNSVLWADVAHPILIGTHGNTQNPDSLGNISFSNIDILDHMELQSDYQGCMSLNAGDSNLIFNVLFDDIRVEDFRKGQLVNLRVFYNKKYCTSPGRGIENVMFRNINYNGKNASTSIIAGYDGQHIIKNVTFENLKINGELIFDNMEKPVWYKTSDMANFFVGEHVDNLRFTINH